MLWNFFFVLNQTDSLTIETMSVNWLLSLDLRSKRTLSESTQVNWSLIWIRAVSKVPHFDLKNINYFLNIEHNLSGIGRERRILICILESWRILNRSIWIMLPLKEKWWEEFKGIFDLKETLIYLFITMPPSKKFETQIW